MRAMNTATHHTAPHSVATLRPAPKPKAPIPQGLGNLADLARLTIKEVCALTGRSESSLRELIAAGKFPAPDHRDGPRCVRWSAGLVRAWLESTRTQA
jgi:excisionase family DNA binding protein